jgi:hypothetical protein
MKFIDARMRTPTKSEIYAEAKRLYFQSEMRNGIRQPNNPEYSELLEGGYISAAQSNLMSNPETLYGLKANKESSPEETDDFRFDIKEGVQTTTFISGSRGTGKSDLAMKIVDRLNREGIISIVFDSSLDWMKRSNIPQSLAVDPYAVLPIPEKDTIFDISRLSPLEQQSAVERFCKSLFEHQLTSTRRYYIVFEESQLFFPLNSLRSKKAQNSMRILTVGRNVGVSACAITQFPALLDKELVKHAGQVYVGMTAEKNAVDYWRSLLGKESKTLKSLDNGAFLYYNRSKIGKVKIEPHERFNVLCEKSLPQPQQLQIAQYDTGDVLVKFCVACLWFVAIVLGLSHMP